MAIVVAHELAHQWFGNLVTMSWWTDLWLNEGFASYMEYLCVDNLFPEWNMWQQFVAGDLGGALSLDALTNTHPVEVAVHHPDEISEVFDAISYEKGSSLIRMLAEYLGPEDFRKGLSHYLKKHSYKNTVTTDLWKSFEIASKKPVTKMMSGWTKTAGHPVVELSQNTDGSITARQKRFYISPIEKNKKSTSLWAIPFSYSDASNKKSILLTKKETKIPTKNFGKANLNETGVYRVTYDSKLLMGLAAKIEKGELSAEDRLGIMRDIHAGLLNCDVSIKDALSILEVYKHEKNYIVWAEIISLLTHIRFVYHGESWMTSFEKFLAGFVEPIYKHVGISKQKEEAHTQVLLRSLILSLLVSLDDKSVIEKGLSLYKKKHIDPDLRSFAYGSVVISGDKKLYDNLVKKYNQQTLLEVKNRIARARLSTAVKSDFKDNLRWVLAGEVRSQDIPMYLAQSLYNRYHKEVAIDFIFKHWDYLVKKYSGDKYTRSRIIGAMDVFDDKETLNKIKIFFKNHEYKGAERTLLQSLEQIEANIYYKKHHRNQLEKFFKSNVKKN